MLTVSVVIPVKNAARTLSACLHALDRLVPAPAEIILVDNGSTDESSAILKVFTLTCKTTRVRLVYESIPGAAAARNAGIRVASGEIVAFTDADCAPQANWLSVLLEPFADVHTGAVAGSLVGVFDRSLCELFSSLYTLQSPREADTFTSWTPWSGGFPTANLAVRRSLLETLQGFDEDVTIYGEDYDLCARLYQQQVSIVYRPDARVTHYHRTTVGGIVRQAFGFGRGQAYLVRRHRPTGLWLELPRLMVRWPNILLHGWVDAASPDKKLFGLVLLGLLYRPMWYLLPCYLLWMTYETRTRARAAGPVLPPTVALSLVWMLLMKAGAMTAGRWWGSFRYGALCL